MRCGAGGFGGLGGGTRPSVDKRELPPGAVIEGKAKRYKQEEGPEATQQYTAAQVRRKGLRRLGESGGSGGSGGSGKSHSSLRPT